MPTVFFVNECLRVEVPKGANLRAAALEHGLDIDRAQFLGLNCRGLGLCGACKVWVKDKTSGATNPRGFSETHLFFRYFKGWRRLACKVRVLGDIEVWTTPGGRDRVESRSIEEPPRVAIAPPEEPKKIVVAKQGPEPAAAATKAAPTTAADTASGAQGPATTS